MKHRLLLATLATLACALLATPLAAQTCTPAGDYIGAGGGYDWIANGLPNSFTQNSPHADCWARTGNPTVVHLSDCGGSGYSWEMHYGDRLTQTITIPSNAHSTHWDLMYDLTMDDPNNDGWWNRLKATVYNVTTGQNVASQTYWGDDPDVTCSTRHLTFTGDLAGKTLQVIFADGSSYTNTHFRIRRVMLVQSN
jgi:hypothetical protein